MCGNCRSKIKTCGKCKLRRRARLSSAAFAAWTLGACAPSAPIPSLTESDEGWQAGALLASSCSGCHAGPGTAIISLDGYTKRDLELALQRYQNDPDGTTVMHRLARGYSPQQVTLLSEYLGSDTAETVE